MKKYKQLTLGLRYQIFAYKNENYTIKKIAELIEVSKSTISRELSRNSNNGYYSADDAHIKAVSRDKFKDRYKKLTNKLKLKSMVIEVVNTRLEVKLNLKFYFCDPYSSWQRGLNEHTNGLVREYIPKKYSFENINQTQITIIQNRLNNRPRKILKYYTPNEIFFKEISRKMAA